MDVGKHITLRAGASGPRCRNLMVGIEYRASGWNGSTENCILVGGGLWFVWATVIFHWKQ